jgi:hypothetical protein
MSVNVKSILLGAAMCAGVIIVTAATQRAKSTTSGIAVERYQLFNHQWWGGDAQPKLQDRHYNNAYLTGVFKIDTSSGQVWALTTSNPAANMVEGWSLIK